MPPHRRQANVISTAAKRFSAPYPTWIIVIVLLYIIFFLPVMVFVLNAWWLEKYNESNIEIKNTLKLHKVQSLTSRVWHVYRRTVEVSRLSHYKPKVKHGSSDATYVEISNSGVPNSETLHGIYVGKPNMLLLHGSLLFHGLSSESQTLTNSMPWLSSIFKEGMEHRKQDKSQFKIAHRTKKSYLRSLSLNRLLYRSLIFSLSRL